MTKQRKQKSFLYTIICGLACLSYAVFSTCKASVTVEYVDCTERQFEGSLQYASYNPEFEYFAVGIEKPLLQSAADFGDIKPDKSIFICIFPSPLFNAFAIPEFRILVANSELIKSYSMTEIQSVFAHETAHLAFGTVPDIVIDRLKKRLILAATSGLIGVMLAGTFSDFANPNNLIATAGGIYMATHAVLMDSFIKVLFSVRSGESGADMSGKKYANSVGISTEDYSKIFAKIDEMLKLSSIESIPEHYKTHPTTRDKFYEKEHKKDHEKEQIIKEQIIKNKSKKNDLFVKFSLSASKGKIKSNNLSLDEMNKMFPKHKQDFESCSARAHYWRLKKNWKKAQEELFIMDQIYPNNPYSKYYSALIDLENKKYLDAETKLKKLIKSGKDSLGIKVNYAKSLIRQNSQAKFPEAKGILDAILMLYSRQPVLAFFMHKDIMKDVLNELILILLQHNRQKEADVLTMGAQSYMLLEETMKQNITEKKAKKHLLRLQDKIDKLPETPYRNTVSKIIRKGIKFIDFIFSL